MSDFLNRLVQRERGAASVVEPRLPSRFEPWSGRDHPFADASGDPLESGEAMTSAPDRSREIRPLTQESSTKNVDFGRRSQMAVRPFSRTLEAAPSVDREDFGADASAREAESPAPNAAIRQSAGSTAAERFARESDAYSVTRERGAAPLVPSAPTVSSVFGSSRLGPNVDGRRADTPPSFSSAPEARETIIEVRIGRIDVRAAPTPASGQSPRVPPNPPRRTLDDFLSGRRAR